jgi:hypothetical protein
MGRTMRWRRRARSILAAADRAPQGGLADFALAARRIANVDLAARMARNAGSTSREKR